MEIVYAYLRQNFTTHLGVVLAILLYIWHRCSYVSISTTIKKLELSYMGRNAHHSDEKIILDGLDPHLAFTSRNVSPESDI